MILPKGRIFSRVADLLNRSGLGIGLNGRNYCPEIEEPYIETKIMKPQNIAQVIELGSHDVGFTGLDWIIESGVDVVEIMNLGFDPVRIVAAIPEHSSYERLLSQKIVVASEYERITKKFMKERGFEYTIIRTHGATEAFPPEDADMIIDNSATGRTLTDNRLKVVAEIMCSSTVFIASADSIKNSWKKEKVGELKLIFTSVIEAMNRVMLEMNVPGDRLDAIVKILPCMRAPTVAPLYNNAGYAVKVAVKRSETIKLIPRLKKMGATDILEYEFKKVVA